MSETFEYSASAVKRFIENLGLFSVMLRDGRIVKHTPENVDTFKQWLREGGALDLSPTPKKE